MKTTTFFLTILYWALLIIDCYLISSQAHEYRYISKLALMPLLFGIIVSEIEKTTKWWSIRILSIALFFAMVGDALLINPDNIVIFMLGILAFWIVQIFYIIYFYRKRPFRKKDAGFLSIASILILAYVILLQLLMWDSLYDRNLLIPIIIYSVTIGFMFLTAINISKSSTMNKIAVFFYIPGALLFVFSDTLIALNEFYFTRPVSNVLIMLSYGTAQFLIIFGSTKFLKKN